jgi:ABC-2 type transport system ATP-binding protein
MAALEAIALSKEYGNTIALNNLNLKISQGEIFCLLGQNGAGKTTTINLFLGFLQPSTGKALVNGFEANTNDVNYKKQIAYIPEVVQLYSNLSGIENVQFFSKLAGVVLSSKQCEDYLYKAHLQATYFTKHLQTYSKGMRQKVGIAIALAKHASVIFMDEPTSGLDPKASAEFTILCKKLATSGTTIFMATHDIFSAVQLASTIGIMKQGKLIHTIKNNNITAQQLQELYLETI